MIWVIYADTPEQLRDAFAKFLRDSAERERPSGADTTKLSLALAASRRNQLELLSQWIAKVEIQPTSTRPGAHPQPTDLGGTNG